MAAFFDILNFGLSSTVVEEIDIAAKRYRATITGEGSGVTTRTEASGIIDEGRFVPTETRSVHDLRGRESRLFVSYDYSRGLVEYHGVSHTLFLGRRRQVDDVLRIPPEQRLDDLVSASLNFAADKLETDGRGTYRTAVVRRSRSENEGPEDVSARGYRAEIVPLQFRATADSATGGLTASVDLTRFSSWARPDRPARVTFGRNRRIESIECTLILGVTFSVRVKPAT